MMSTSNRILSYPVWPTLSLFECESNQKYENKYDISDIRPYPIRFHPKEEIAVLAHCVRVAWYFNLVGSVYIAHAAGGGTEDGWRDVSNTSYKRDIYTRAR
jgi:hypothetical protein